MGAAHALLCQVLVRGSGNEALAGEGVRSGGWCQRRVCQVRAVKDAWQAHSTGRWEHRQASPPVLRWRTHPSALHCACGVVVDASQHRRHAVDVIDATPAGVAQGCTGGSGHGERRRRRRGGDRRADCSRQPIGSPHDLKISSETIEKPRSPPRCSSSRATLWQQTPQSGPSAEFPAGSAIVTEREIHPSLGAAIDTCLRGSASHPVLAAARPTSTAQSHATAWHALPLMKLALQLPLYFIVKHSRKARCRA